MTNNITKVTEQCSPLQCFEEVGAGQSVANEEGADAYTACQCGSLFKPVAMALLLGKLWGSRPPSSADIFNDAAESYGAKLHDDWRESRAIVSGSEKAIDGKDLREPRWKAVPSEDPALANISGNFKRNDTKDGKPVTEVDIANLDFAHLPEKWAFENREAAKAAMGIVKGAAGKLTGAEEDSLANPVTVKIDLEAAAAKVHDQWLARNGSWAPPEQNKPYAELTEEEKAKDRAIVIGAFESLNAEVAEQDVLSVPPISRGLARILEQQGDILMKQGSFKDAEAAYTKATKYWSDYPTSKRTGVVDRDEHRGQPLIIGRQGYMQLLDKTAGAIQAQAFEAQDPKILERAAQVYHDAYTFMDGYLRDDTDPLPMELRGRESAVLFESRAILKLPKADDWTLINYLRDAYKGLEQLYPEERDIGRSFHEFYGELMMNAGDYKAAARSYLKAAKETDNKVKYEKLIDKAAKAITRLADNEPKGSKFLYKAAQVYRAGAFELSQLGDEDGANKLTKKAFEMNVQADVVRLAEKVFPKDAQRRITYRNMSSRVIAALEDEAFRDKYVYRNRAGNEQGISEKGIVEFVATKVLLPSIASLETEGSYASFDLIAKRYAELCRLYLSIGDFEAALKVSAKEANAWRDGGRHEVADEAFKRIPKIIEKASRANLAALKEGIASGRIDPVAERKMLGELRALGTKGADQLGAIGTKKGEGGKRPGKKAEEKGPGK